MEFPSDKKRWAEIAPYSEPRGSAPHDSLRVQQKLIRTILSALRCTMCAEGVVFMGVGIEFCLPDGINLPVGVKARHICF